MRHIHFDPEPDGFYGAFWEREGGGEAAIVAMLGDDPEDHLAKSGARWLHEMGVHALTMSPDKKDYGHHNYPLERIEEAIAWLHGRGIQKVGITGASTTGTLALTAASFFPDITLTFAMTPSDFVWQGFMEGKRDGCREWPVEGESLFSWRGEPLPYMPFVYQHPEYWRVVEEESKRTHNVTASRKLFDDSEAAHRHAEDEMIKVERIRGKLLVVAAEDDALWDAAKYVRRMEARLEGRPHECDAELVAYEHGTHFVFPESFLREAIPVFPDALVGLCFPAAKKFPKECRATRDDIDRRVRRAVAEWLDAV